MRQKNRAGGIDAGRSFFWTVTLLLALAGFWQIWTAGRELPDLVEWYDSQGFAYSPKQLERLAKSPDVGVLAQAHLPVEGQLPMGVSKRNVIMADTEYFAWCGLEPETGQWPQETGEAMVSSEWALSYYKHFDIIGQSIQVNGRTYRISGVYRARSSWRQKMSEDGMQAVYLSFCPQDLSQEYEVNYIYFPKKGGDLQSCLAYLEDVAARASGVHREPEVMLDIESVRHVCMQNAAVCLMLWLLAAAFYFRERGNKTVSLLSVVLFLAVIVCHRWYIPMEYLPKEQIFDFSAYMEQYVQRQNLRHWYQESGYFGNLTFIHTWMSFGMLAVTGSFAAVLAFQSAVKLLYRAIICSLKKERDGTE